MELQNFLAEAKKNGYALGGEKSEKRNADGGKKITFEEGEFRYVDVYYGHNPFIGQEIVYENGTAIWGMNYYGYTMSNKVGSKRIYTFLRKALQKVNSRYPFRGPDYFSERGLLYLNKKEGTVQKFSGTEQIIFKGVIVYELHYRGGHVRNSR